MLVILGLVMFVTTVAIEWADVAYTRAVQELEPGRASRYGTSMFVLGAIGWVSAVKFSVWLLIPEGAGVYVGIYLAVAAARRRASCIVIAD